MEESKGNLQKKKIAIKMSGGGIGAVVLLGGALASAALASAFVVGKNGWSSGKDHRRRRNRSPSPAVNKQKEQGGAEKGQEQVVVDEPSHEDKNPSLEAIKWAESDHDRPFLDSNQSSTQDEKPKSEQISNETPNNISDIETTDDSLCPITPEKSETDYIHNGSVVIEETDPFSDVKPRNEPQNTTHVDEAPVKLAERDVATEIPKDGQNLERAEGEPIIEITHKQTKQDENDEVCLNHEEIKVILVDKSIEEVIFYEKESKTKVGVEMEKEIRESDEVRECYNGETMLSKNVLEDCVMDQESVTGEEEKFISPIEIVEIIKENECFEGSEEDDRSKCIKEQSVEEDKKCTDLTEVIVKEDKIPDYKKEENDRKFYVTSQDMHLGGLEMVKEETFLSEISKDDQENNLVGVEGKEGEKEPMSAENTKDRENDELESDIKKEVEFELIPPNNIGVTRGHNNVDLEKDNEEEVEFEPVSLENLSVTNDHKTIDLDKGIEEEVESPVEQKPNQINDLEKDIKEEGEAEQNSPQDIKVTQDDDTESEKTAQGHVKTNILAKIEDLSSKTVAITEVDLVKEKIESKEKGEDPIKNLRDVAFLSDEVRLVDREVGGKIQEDKSVKKIDHNSRVTQTECKVEKSIIKKYVDELAVSKEVCFVSSTHRMIIIATLSVASSLSCSWFFGLSFAKLCIVVFMTMLLSSMVVQ